MAHLRRQGLLPDDVGVVAGAAGGPKWLVLSQLDRVLFGSWLAARRTPLALLGASIGAWRFAAVSRRQPLAALTAFEEAYIAQAYSAAPSPRDVSVTSASILRAVLGDSGADEVLSHPTQRLTAIVARCLGPAASDRYLIQGAGLAAAAALNVVSRRGLGVSFRREAFYDARAAPAVVAAAGYACGANVLNGQSLPSVLLASGSIPLVMEGVRGLGPGAGVYRDGGILDYHMDVPFRLQPGKLVLFPHFGERIIPGWFDKGLPWRRAAAAHMDNVLLVYPSPAFVARLPGGKVPDRRDFHQYQGRDAERMRAWHQTLAACRELADEWEDVASRDRWHEVALPLEL